MTDFIIENSFTGIHQRSFHVDYYDCRIRYIGKFGFRLPLAEAAAADLRGFRWQFVVSAQVLSYCNSSADFGE
jgi:hypothetical protein